MGKRVERESRERASYPPTPAPLQPLESRKTQCLSKQARIHQFSRDSSSYFITLHPPTHLYKKP